MTNMIGHNQGPTLERGHTYRSYQWRQAQRKLMPNTIPLAIVKMRLRRAAELGLDYKAYAAIRQATGRDICGFLFSSNALSILAGQSAMPKERRAKLEGLTSTQRLALVHAPLDPATVQQQNPLEAATRAPDLRHSWSVTSDRLRDFIAERRLVGDQIVLIGDTALEEEWRTAARVAGYLPATRYFAA